MTLPPNVKGLIAETGGLALPGVLAEQQTCEGAKFHSPSPLLLDNYVLADGQVHRAEEFSGEDSFISVWLCGTCKDNVQVFLGLMHTYGGPLPWIVRREFGNLVRAIGERAWKAMEDSRA